MNTCRTCHWHAKGGYGHGSCTHESASRDVPRNPLDGSLESLSAYLNRKIGPCGKTGVYWRWGQARGQARPGIMRRLRRALGL